MESVVGLVIRLSWLPGKGCIDFIYIVGFPPESPPPPTKFSSASICIQFAAAGVFVSSRGFSHVQGRWISSEYEILILGSNNLK